jgi:hypothetical protein
LENGLITGEAQLYSLTALFLEENPTKSKDEDTSDKGTKYLPRNYHLFLLSAKFLVRALRRAQ